MEALTLLYSKDGGSFGVGAITTQCVGISIFGAQIAFAVFNAIKFYRHRSYALGLFYILTIINFFCRMCFFITNFIAHDLYWNLICLALPASFSCAIGLCQIMNYTVLYIRLDSYANHRAKKGLEVATADLDRTPQKELIMTVVFTIIILAYPLVVGIVLFCRRDLYDNNVITNWQYFELFYVINIIIITILLVISTTLALRHMRKVFGA